MCRNWCEALPLCLFVYILVLQILTIFQFIWKYAIQNYSDFFDVSQLVRSYASVFILPYLNFWSELIYNCITEIFGSTKDSSISR